MYECPNCKQRVIPFYKKFLIGPLLHCHCPNCKASLSATYTVFFLIVAFGALYLAVRIVDLFHIFSFDLMILEIITGALWVLVPAYYWIFHAKIVIAD